MDEKGASSSTQNACGEKPVIVRVKRKVRQYPLDAFWLEINERPFKRPLLDFGNLSISDSNEKEDLKPKKVLVRHVETVTNSETTIDILHSFFESVPSDHSGSKEKIEERKMAFKKDDKKEQRLTKAVQQQQIAAENARFEQIWRSRKGEKEGVHDKAFHERCHFYDVIRVDAEESPGNAPECTSLEDQKLLAGYLDLLRECIPTAAKEIEDDIHASHTEEFVYDYYAVNNEDISEDASKNHFPLVQVEEEDFYDGPDESEYETDDSNAEDNPRNDYPEEEISDEEEEEEEDEEGSEEEEREEDEEEAMNESSDENTSGPKIKSRAIEDDDFDDYEEDADSCQESGEEFENRKWSYR